MIVDGCSHGATVSGQQSLRNTNPHRTTCPSQHSAHLASEVTVSLPLQSSAFITCALTGSGDSTGISDKVPVTPAQIADSALEAAAAGAAVVHIHVRDPETGKGSRRPEYFREVVERVRDSKVNVVLNLTTGMGGDLVLGGPEKPLPHDDVGTDMAGATERLQHVKELMPEICTL